MELSERMRRGREGVRRATSPEGRKEGLRRGERGKGLG
jgi:hypothetical protein